MKQKNINLDKEIEACKYVRKEILQGIDNINELLKQLKVLPLYLSKDKYVTEFVIFIENLCNKKYNEQKNNHNYMDTFLKEKINDYKRIKYDELKESLKRGKISYASNVSPGSIFSNYYLSNETEHILLVDKLETAFRNFTRSERYHLSQINQFIDLGDIPVIREGKKIILKNAKYQINQEELYKGEIEDIKKYFVLQLTRREFFLYDIIKKCIQNKDLESLDLLDYLYSKYIYNSCLEQNYENWMQYIGNKPFEVYQIQYKQSKLGIKHKEALKIKKMPEEKDTVLSNIAITESHTFFVYELLTSINFSYLNHTLKLNGMKVFTKEEIERTKKLLVTLGSNSKLCYLMVENINQKIFEKINFVVHYFWDKCMINQVLINLLIKKDSELNNLKSFQNISPEVLERAQFMKTIFCFSEKCEDSIKNNKITKTNKLNKEQIKEYLEPKESGFFIGVLDDKRWGRDSNLWCYFTLDNGNKIKLSCPRYKNKTYSAKDEKYDFSLINNESKKFKLTVVYMENLIFEKAEVI